MVYRLFLLRHGESIWNAGNLHTGWANVCLTPNGKESMYQAAEKIINHNVFPSVSFISSLQRSIDSNNILLQHLNNPSMDIHQSWRLNERHYGLLTGHNKLTYNWKGGYFDMPPLVDPAIEMKEISQQYSEYYPRYGESYYMTYLRVLPTWQLIQFKMKCGEIPLICGHQNVFRVLMAKIENIPITEIQNIEVPNATPLLYTFDQHWNIIDKKIL